MSKHVLINECGNADGFVKEKTLYEYTVECWCGEVWLWTSREPKSPRYIVDMMAEECWTLDDDSHPRCPKCLRKKRQGLQPRDPDNLGKNQRGVLSSIREHGQWHSRGFGCGWVWDTPSNTRKILDTLVKRGLVTLDEKGTYRPV